MSNTGNTGAPCCHQCEEHVCGVRCSTLKEAMDGLREQTSQEGKAHTQLAQTLNQMAQDVAAFSKGMRDQHKQVSPPLPTNSLSLLP